MHREDTTPYAKGAHLFVNKIASTTESERGSYLQSFPFPCPSSVSIFPQKTVLKTALAQSSEIATDWTEGQMRNLSIPPSGLVSKSAQCYKKY